MKKVLGIAGLLLAVIIMAAGGVYVWASVTAGRLLSRTFETHSVEFPVPFPLSAEESGALTPDQAEQLALERARERGRHLVMARYGCIECHGSDFSGGAMVDDALVGHLLGPNITGGQGGKVTYFAPRDWDRIVRHGVLPDGRPTAMPAEDYRFMSDQELSDIVAFITSQPPIDNEVPPISLGPLGKFLVATGRIRLSADMMESHDAKHAEYPPAAEVSLEFGQHLATTCVGCHGHDLGGGPIFGGDPSWAPARNLTPDVTGLAEWSYEQFVVAMREGVRPDGSALRSPMTMVVPYAQKMTDVELQAVWEYLRSVPPVSR